MITPIENNFQDKKTILINGGYWFNLAFLVISAAVVMWSRARWDKSGLAYHLFGKRDLEKKFFQEFSKV